MFAYSWSLSTACHCLTGARHLSSSYQNDRRPTARASFPRQRTGPLPRASPLALISRPRHLLAHHCNVLVCPATVSNAMIPSPNTQLVSYEDQLIPSQSRALFQRWNPSDLLGRMPILMLLATPSAFTFGGWLNGPLTLILRRYGDLPCSLCRLSNTSPVSNLSMQPVLITHLPLFWHSPQEVLPSSATDL